MDEQARTIAYGDDASQFGELNLPDDAPRGVVVVIHGGFWKAAYDLSLGRPLAQSLVAEGWAAWNLEYRRVGNGGGTPQTFGDVAAGIDRLASLEGLDLATVVTLGHSAGGHLAAWAAGRTDPVVPVTGVVSQAGVIDLVRAHELGLGGGAVEALLGHPPGMTDAPYDPYQQLPLHVPVRCVHGAGDVIVPIEISERYVAAASDAGGDATLTAVEGDHFVVIDAGSDAWERTLRLLDELA
ncbi:MAG: alpha/beta hydrolase family protein [Nocardioides sp.]